MRRQSNVNEPAAMSAVTVVLMSFVSANMIGTRFAPNELSMPSSPSVLTLAGLAPENGLQ